ncbi:synaptonemal complex protein 1 isoform X3 [Tympanuchus pallidicinctus]|uniref:synaptonemal complex protein 1 isoform X3 n=1 Tax=Tympanuchus pallidicinctus TaxID=109042 RepID=UPI002286D474|nr:synaptonemal complex protein 1 isoform X3 [Tympanuchus pallidicinctus]
MEKGKPFKLFVPPRLSGGQVSAVKPQTSARAAEPCQGFNKCPGDDFNLPFVMTTAASHGEITDADSISQQTKLCPEVDEENLETMNELYSKLYKEAEKIKRWKLAVESELKQKERKFQENRKIIEAQRKAIQELQFENEKLSLKLEDEICENKDLLKENSASRHLCNLLKETCSHFTEKSTKYEHEREETRQLYEELNNNIERMIVAFEELRVQAENTRLEMCFKLKEAEEKMDNFERESKLEVSMKEKQISDLTARCNEKDDVIRDIKTHLQESKNKIADLEEAKRHEGEMLKESQLNQEYLKAELEEAKNSLRKTEATQESLETELQSTVKALIQVTQEKETQMEECKEAKALHASMLEEFEASTYNLKSLLQEEQNRLKKYKDESKLLTLELTNKSAELEEMTKLKHEKEMQLEELSEALKELHDLTVQLTCSVEKEQNYLKQLTSLNADLEREAQKNEQLTVTINTLLLEKEQMAQEKSNMATELKKLQESHEDQREKEENIKQLVEHLEEANGQLRNELESLREKMAKKGEEVKSKLDESEENTKSIENEILKKERQLKMLENKLNTMKKQVENKTKCIEELQQENKALKKKMTAESKKTSSYEGKVNKLQLEMENMNKQHKARVDIYEKEIEAKGVTENNLLEEVEKMRLLADEATIAQREADIRCQHKITEMMALMEKHKHEYDKMVEEKDTELKLYKIKEQEQASLKRALETELSCLKSELSSLKEQLKAEIENKKIQTHFSETPKPHSDPDSASINVKKLFSQSDIPIKTSVMESTKTSPRAFLQSPLVRRSLKSLVSDEEVFKKLYKDYPQASQLYAMTPKQKPTASNLKAPSSALKLATMRKVRETGWTAVSKMDRKRKIKDSEKLFS